MTRVLDTVKIDFAPNHRQPPLASVLVATIVALAGSPLKTPKDFVGKTIAVSGLQDLVYWAVRAWVSDGKVNPDDVKSIVVRLAHTEARTVNDREMPDICLQHVIAVMLLDKTASFEAAHDKARMSDPAILKQRAKVQLIESEELEQLEPARQAIIEITLNDGSVLSHRVTAVRGTADNPMTRDEVAAKARDLIDPVLGKQSGARLVEKVYALEQVRDITELRQHCPR